MLERQVIDTKTGEVISRDKLGENSNFVMLFRGSMFTMRELAKKDAKASVLLNLLLEYMDRENALMVSQKTLSELLDWSIPTIERKLRVLRDSNFIEVLKSGHSNIYLVNASIAWTTYGNKREYAKLRGNILISQSEQEYRAKEKRFKQLDLLPIATRQKPTN